MATAADCPNKYDLVVGDKGFLLAPSSKVEGAKAQMRYTPTLIPLDLTALRDDLLSLHVREVDGDE